MDSLTPRQRVLMALQHQEPDRIPTALGGGPYGIVDELYYQCLDYFDLGEPVPPFRSGHNISFMDDRVLDCLGTDLRYVYPSDSPTSPSQTVEQSDRFMDAFGQSWVRALPYYYAGPGILAEAQTVEQIDRWVNWPDINDPRWTEGVSERAAALRNGGKHFIVARMVASHGPYQTACDLRGMERFLMDMIENPDFALHLIEHITETYSALMLKYVQACGANIDMIELPGDDYAGNTNLIISVSMFRRFIRPALRRFVETIKSYRPELKVMFHSDGAITKLIPDLIEIGIDVIHPLEPLPIMDLEAIKSAYGKQVSFLGGIDIAHAMTGSIEDVRREVKRRVIQLAKGGGYILAPANHLQADVPAENVAALYCFAREYGKYPLSNND
jgi:uroporphyrinogen decarboxylase